MLQNQNAKERREGYPCMLMGTAASPSSAASKSTSLTLTVLLRLESQEPDQ